MEQKRKCIACGEIKPKSELIKITKEYSSGDIVVQPDSKIFGRSAYLCYNENCINTAIKKGVVKKRYFAKIEGHDAEVDVFLEDLAGLVLVDFEFSDAEEKNKFKMPKSLLADVTPEEFIAGGMLAGKKYEEIEGKLEEFGYKRIKGEA